MYNLGNLKFIKNIDEAGIIIDEGVWHEVNSLLARIPLGKESRSILLQPVNLFLSGELQTRKEAEQLSSYISLNFPYLDLLKKQIVVEEDVVNQIQWPLREAQLTDIIPKMKRRNHLNRNIPRETG